MAKTVLLIDDHELIRHGLRLAFERSDDFTVVGEAGSVADGLRLAREHAPDVAVVDMRLPDGTGLDATRGLRELFPDIGVVILTMYAGDDHLFAALDAGASAFVAKNAASGDVVTAARHAIDAPHSFTTKDLASAMRRRLTPTGPQLSERERQVLGPAGRWSRRHRHLPHPLRLRLHHQDPHRPALREARCGESRAGDHERGAGPACSHATTTAVRPSPSELIGRVPASTADTRSRSVASPKN